MLKTLFQAMFFVMLEPEPNHVRMYQVFPFEGQGVLLCVPGLGMLPIPSVYWQPSAFH